MLRAEIALTTPGTLLAATEYKTHNDLPLARIKRVMKADEDVRMISAEAPVLLAKAVEMFVVDLSMRHVKLLAHCRPRCDTD